MLVKLWPSPYLRSREAAKASSEREISAAAYKNPATGRNVGRKRGKAEVVADCFSSLPQQWPLGAYSWGLYNSSASFAGMSAC